MHTAYVTNCMSHLICIISSQVNQYRWISVDIRSGEWSLNCLDKNWIKLWSEKSFLHIFRYMYVQNNLSPPPFDLESGAPSIRFKCTIEEHNKTVKDKKYSRNDWARKSEQVACAVNLAVFSRFLGAEIVVSVYVRLAISVFTIWIRRSNLHLDNL